MANLDSKIPQGSLSEKWTNHKSKINLVSPANKRLIDVIVVGSPEQIRELIHKSDNRELLRG